MRAFKNKSAVLDALCDLQIEIAKNCGDGAGGFKPGNQCQGGGSGGGGSSETAPNGKEESKPISSRFNVESHFNKINKSLPDDAKSAFHTYSHAGYITINAGLRGEMPLNADKAKIAKTISGVIENHGALPIPIKTYRIMTFPTVHDGDKALSKFKGGETISMSGFTSTSTSEKPIIKGMKESDNPVKVIMNIKAIKGIFLGKMSKYPEEKEFLMDHNSKFKVLRVDHAVGNVHVIHLEQVA